MKLKKVSSGQSLPETQPEPACLGTAPGRGQAGAPSEGAHSALAAPWAAPAGAGPAHQGYPLCSAPRRSHPKSVPGLGLLVQERLNWRGSEAEEREVAQPGEESAVGRRPQQPPVPVRGLLRSWSSSL